MTDKSKNGIQLPARTLSIIRLSIAAALLLVLVPSRIAYQQYERGLQPLAAARDESFKKPINFHLPSIEPNTVITRESMEYYKQSLEKHLAEQISYRNSVSSAFDAYYNKHKMTRELAPLFSWVSAIYGVGGLIFTFCIPVISDKTKPGNVRSEPEQ